jgi:uncharacterized ParB-like nuclease family protein
VKKTAAQLDREIAEALIGPLKTIKLVADADKIWKWNEAFDEPRVSRIAQSMEEDGWAGDPLVVVEAGGGRYLALTGSHRLEAAERTGTTVPAVVLKLPKGWKVKGGAEWGLYRRDDRIYDSDEMRDALAEDGTDPRVVALLNS